jgi:hypothetical protein
MYASQDFPSIRYAQNLKEIIFTHGSYRIFRMVFISSRNTETDVVTYSIEYGVMSVTGNIAYTPKMGDEDDVLTPISLTQIESAFYGNIPDNTSIVATGSRIRLNGVERTLTAVRINAITSSRSAKLSLVIKDLLGSVIHRSTKRAIELGSGYTDLWATEIVGSLSMHVGGGSDTKFDFSISNTGVLNLTNTALINAIETATDKKNLTYRISESGNAGYTGVGSLEYVPSSTSKSITVYWSGGSEVLDSDDIISGYIKLTDYTVIINREAIASNNALDRLAPWMDVDIPYFCSSDSTINGAIPVTATKRVVLGEPSIELYFEDAEPMYFRRDSATEFVGQVGVIVTPFYGEIEHFADACCYHQGRLCLARGNVVFMSKVNDYTNFCYFEEVEYERTVLALDGVTVVTKQDIIQQIGMASAIKYILATEENESVMWMASVADLVIGTETSEWISPVDASAINPYVKLTSRDGSCAIQGRFIMGSVIFVSPSSRLVKVFQPNYGQTSQSISDYADHITKIGIVGFDFRQEPMQEMFFVLADGTVARGTFTGRGAEATVAWSKIVTKSGDAIIGVACIASGDEDAVYFVVRRIVGVSVEINIERFTTNENDTFYHRFYLDSAVMRTAT